MGSFAASVLSFTPKERVSKVRHLQANSAPTRRLQHSLYAVPKCTTSRNQTTRTLVVPELCGDTQALQKFSAQQLALYTLFSCLCVVTMLDNKNNEAKWQASRELGTTLLGVGGVGTQVW